MVRAQRHLPVLPDRPVVRGDCEDAVRPCPWVSCRYHLLLDVASDGRLYVNGRWRGKGDSLLRVLGEMPETCALDVAGRGGATSSVIGNILGVRRDTVETLIGVATKQLRKFEFEERDHPDDPYLKYTNMGADELAEISSLLRRRAKSKSNP